MSKEMVYCFTVGAQDVRMTFLRVGHERVIRGTAAWSGRGPTVLNKVEREKYARERATVLAAVKAQLGIPAEENRPFDVIHAFTSAAGGPKLRTR